MPTGMHKILERCEQDKSQRDYRGKILESLSGVALQAGERPTWTGQAVKHPPSIIKGILGDAWRVANPIGGRRFCFRIWALGQF